MLIIKLTNTNLDQMDIVLTELCSLSTETSGHAQQTGDGATSSTVRKGVLVILDSSILY